ncbi:MAG: glycosyltransferase family 4 protein [Bacteroidales bacterium]
MKQPTKLYLIKSLAPWMMEELITFSEFVNFKIIFFKNIVDFYSKDLEILKAKGIEYHIKPFVKIPGFKDLLFAFRFIFSNLHLLTKKKSAIWTLHGTFWFLFIDKKLFQNVQSIHSQFASQATMVAWYFKHRYNIDYYFTFHAHSIYCKNKLFPVLLDGCKASFSISEYNINYVEKEYGVKRDKILLARLGLKLPELIEVKKEFKKPFVLGFMSNLEPKKGIPYLLEAFNILNSRNPGKFELWIAGKGELMDFIENFIEKHKLQKEIKILGRIRDQKKVEFYNKIDLFVLPSIVIPNDMDGIPVVLMEAIGYGKPIISTNVSGIPEICVNDLVGKLVPEKDAQIIVEAVEELSTDNQKWQRLSENALKFAKEEYDLRKNTELKLRLMNWL